MPMHTVMQSYLRRSKIELKLMSESSLQSWSSECMNLTNDLVSPSINTPACRNVLVCTVRMHVQPDVWK